MKNKFGYKNVLAGLLAIILLYAFAIKELHHIHIHSHDHDHPVCVAGVGDQHIHTADYTPESCFLCFVQISDTTPSVEELTIALKKRFSQGLFNYESFSFVAATTTIFLRGPPSL